MTFRPIYALATIALLLIELFIAFHMHDAFIRPYGGDILAVVLVYTGLRTITRMDVRTGLIVALAIAFAIEFGQMFHLVNRLGLAHNRLARLVLGGVFDVMDLGCYVVGTLATGAVEWLIRRKAEPAR